MKTAPRTFLLLAAAALAAAARPARAVDVDISLNVFPTNLANTNLGGAWDLVAKTDSPHGIAGISAYLRNIDVAGLTMEADIGAILNNGEPFAGNFGGVINLVYAQDTAAGPVVLGVGTLVTSDGPDPLGNPAWDDATRIMSGFYSANLPFFTTLGANFTDANTLSTSVGPPFNFAINADTTAVVRVFVPEPAAIGMALLALAGLVLVRRR